MIGYLLVVPVVLVAGYVLARYHSRLRDLGIGTAVGTAVNSVTSSLPSVSDVHGHADGRHGHAHDHFPGISHGGDAHGAGDWGGHHDSTSAHGHADF